MIASQRSRPTTSRYIQNLPRSRYSHPCAPKKGRSRIDRYPWKLRYSPAMLPTTTTTSAPSRASERAAWPRGSRPVISGARKIPAAR